MRKGVYSWLSCRVLGNLVPPLLSLYRCTRFMKKLLEIYGFRRFFHVPFFHLIARGPPADVGGIQKINYGWGQSYTLVVSYIFLGRKFTHIYVKKHVIVLTNITKLRKSAEKRFGNRSKCTENDSNCVLYTNICKTYKNLLRSQRAFHTFPYLRIYVNIT